MLALPLLVTLGAAIGNSRTIRVNSTWQQSTAIYGAVVAETGSMKTPVLKLVTDPLRNAQTEHRRTWTSDTTVERFAELLHDQPRGLLIYTDELTGFFRSMNQYKKGGADREFYLSSWSSESFVIDRKQVTAEHKKVSIHVPRPFVSFVGCIPPALIPKLTLGESLEDGFLQRILFAEPRAVPVRLVKEGIGPSVLATYAELVTSLLALDGQAGEPQVLDLTPGAWDRYQQWHDAHCELSEGENVSSALRGFYSKHKGYCLRLALIHAVSSDPDACQVDVESVQAAIEQTEYFKQQAAQVVSRLNVGVGTVGSKEYRVWLCRERIVKGFREGRFHTRRDAQRMGNYPAEIFREAWDSLVHPSRLIEGPKDNFSLNERDKPTDLLVDAEGSTDTPTTDIPDEPAA